jgi:hypothetical protein
LWTSKLNINGSIQSTLPKSFLVDLVNYFVD